MTRALIFAGQGQQFLHMGQDLAFEYPVVKEYYDIAKELTGIDVLHLSQEALDQTENTQLALYVLETAIAKLLLGIDVAVVAGLSLGEYAALTYAEVFDYETGLKLIQSRGQIMSQAFKPGETSMAAVLRTNIETIEEVIKDTGIEVCNYNTASQIVIGGYQDELNVVVNKLKEVGVKMVIPLKVSSVSHMSLLNEAANELRFELDQIKFKKPKVDFIANVTADYQIEGFADSLQKQISQRTRMFETIERMVQDGITEFVEIGPKGSISKFVKASGKELRTFNIYDLNSLNQFLERDLNDE